MATMALTKDTKFDNKRTKEKETNILKILSQIQNEKKKKKVDLVPTTVWYLYIYHWLAQLVQVYTVLMFFSRPC